MSLGYKRLKPTGYVMHQQV